MGCDVLTDLASVSRLPKTLVFDLFDSCSNWSMCLLRPNFWMQMTPLYMY